MISPSKTVRRDTVSKHLLLTSDFPPVPGGLSTYFYHLWKRLPIGKTIILSPQREGADEFDRREGFETYRRKHLLHQGLLGKWTKPLFFLAYTLDIMKKENVRALHCGQLLPIGLASFLTSRWFGLPSYVYIIATEFHKYGRFRPIKMYMKMVLRHATKVIVISDYTRQQVLTHSGIEESKVVKITPGVDAETFKPLAKNQELVQQYHLEGKEVILTVSRLDENKGHDKVIEALPLILKEIPNVLYLIAGSGPMEGRLRGLVRKLGLEDKVLFLGYVPGETLPDFYNLCDVFVLATREGERSKVIEGFGIVFLEASACGKPVVAGRTGGAVEAVLDGETGLLVDPLNIEEIAAATVRLLQDHALASRLGNQGRKRMVESFSWEERAERIGQLIGLSQSR